MDQESREYTYRKRTRHNPTSLPEASSHIEIAFRNGCSRLKFGFQVSSLNPREVVLIRPWYAHNQNDWQTYNMYNLSLLNHSADRGMPIIKTTDRLIYIYILIASFCFHSPTTPFKKKKKNHRPVAEEAPRKFRHFFPPFLISSLWTSLKNKIMKSSRGDSFVCFTNLEHCGVN